MRTAAGKVVLWDAVTQAQGEYWPIDARAMCAAGSHVAEPPDGADVKVPVMPPKRAGVPVATPSPVAVAMDAGVESVPARRRRTPPQDG